MSEGGDTVTGSGSTLLTQRLVEAVAENMYRRYASEYEAGHLSWEDFATEARKDIAPVLRLLIDDAEQFKPPAVLVYRGEATGRLTMYLDDLPKIVKLWLAALAESVERGE